MGEGVSEFSTRNGGRSRTTIPANLLSLSVFRADVVRVVDILTALARIGGASEKYSGGLRGAWECMGTRAAAGGWWVAREEVLGNVGVCRPFGGSLVG